MTRLVRMISHFFEMLGAAAGAAAATRNHHMPTAHQLAVLGISENQFRRIHL